MAHFGIVCPPAQGHWNSLYAYGRELTRRGHRVTAIGYPDARRHAERAELGFAEMAADVFPEGSIANVRRRVGELSGHRAMGEVVRFARRQLAIQLEELPAVLRRLQVDAVLADQMCPGAGTACDVAEVPYVTACSAVMLEREPGVPPHNVYWKYRPSVLGRLRNRFAHWVVWKLFWAMRRSVNAVRRQHGLELLSRPDQYSSPWATVSQMPEAFDLPRERLPETFHYAGPFTDPEIRQSTPFPFEKLDGRPLIYASLGTLQNWRPSIFHCIAEACAGRDAQLVITLGRPDAEIPVDLPGNPLVVQYAPQLELVRRAALTITHAGLNTVLESLTAGVPLVAIPIATDQPGVATRIEWHHVGIGIAPKRLSVPRLRSAVERVLGDARFRENAQRIQRAIVDAQGLRRAADVAEAVVATRQPVRRSGA